LGTHKPSDQSVPLSILNQMIHELKPSPEVKRFLRHVLNTLLPSILQSRKLYEKITLA
jgi:hypothetical protein